MTKIDIIIFLIAALLGSFGSTITVSARTLNVAWLIVAVWCVLKLFGLL